MARTRICIWPMTNSKSGEGAFFEDIGSRDTIADIFLPDWIVCGNINGSAPV